MENPKQTKRLTGAEELERLRRPIAIVAAKYCVANGKRWASAICVVVEDGDFTRFFLDPVELSDDAPVEKGVLRALRESGTLDGVDKRSVCYWSERAKSFKALGEPPLDLPVEGWVPGNQKEQER